MKKHALSHAFGSFFSLIAAVGLSALVRDFLPSFYSSFISLAGQIAEKLPVDISDKVLGYAILSSLIMLVWGAGFYLLNDDESDDEYFRFR